MKQEYVFHIHLNYVVSSLTRNFGAQGRQGCADHQKIEIGCTTEHLFLGTGAAAIAMLAWAMTTAALAACLLVGTVMLQGYWGHSGAPSKSGPGVGASPIYP